MVSRTPLRGDQSEDHPLPLGYKARRLEAARTSVVIFEEEAVDVAFAVERLRDQVVATLGGPARLEVLSTRVGRNRPVIATTPSAVFDLLDVALVLVLGVVASFSDHLALRRVMEVRERR